MTALAMLAAIGASQVDAGLTWLDHGDTLRDVVHGVAHAAPTFLGRLGIMMGTHHAAGAGIRCVRHKIEQHKASRSRDTRTISDEQARRKGG
jgi:hypothetical protein